MTRFLLVLLLALMMAACARTPVRSGSDAHLLAAQSAREAALVNDTDWSLTGRLAVSAQGEGGSGRIEWRQQGQDYEIRLSAPVTRKSWLLRSAQGRVTLEGLEGGTRSGDDAEALLAEATGWRIPVRALAAWARGARASGPAEIEFGPDGLPALISQQGWSVEYREWKTGTPALPRRVFARQGDQASVRLVVESWDPP